MRGPRFAALVAVAAAATVVAVAPVRGGGDAAATATLTPVADSYVRADAPRRNFGKAGTLVVAGRPAATAYLRFRVAVPAGGTVTRATLQLFATARASSGFTVHPVASTTWGETTVTYRNAPPVGAGVAVSSGPRRGAGYVPVDVTPLVTRSGLVSLAVKGLSRTPLAFGSREARSGRPRLVVETSTPAPGTVTGPTGGGGAGGGGNPSAAPCGTATTPPARIDHVIWIWMENKPYDAVIGSSSAPYENELAAACGLATNYHAVTHPSLPNYVAATSGGTQGIADDEPPAAHPLGVDSVFGQVKAAGKTWRSYQESAPGNCALESSGSYAVKHDPAAYYTGIRADCAVWDVPLGTTSGGNLAADLANGTLPAFAFVTPNLCNDTHDCPVATGDAWLKPWFAKILASPTYLEGRTVVFLTWDEDDGSATNRVPLIVVSPSTRPGTQSAASFDHYSLLKTAEQLLGLTPLLGHAGDPGTASMASAFNLG